MGIIAGDWRRGRGIEASAKSGANITWVVARKVVLGEGSLSACIMETNTQKLPPKVCFLLRSETATSKYGEFRLISFS